MDNQITFEIAKYVENNSNIPEGRLQNAFKSKEVKLTRFLLARKAIERKMTTRENLKLLKEKNIYRENFQVVNFGNIHTKLENMMSRRPSRKHVFPGTRISPRIARLVKKLDFELRRKILRRVIAREYG